jgi:hypothetical protein
VPDVDIDNIDTMVFTATSQIRQEFEAARKRLNLPPRDLTAVTLGMRSVR